MNFLEEFITPPYQRKGDLINFIMQIEDLDTKGACLFLGKGLDKLYLTGI